MMDPYQNNREIGRGQKVFNTIYVEMVTDKDPKGLVLTCMDGCVSGLPEACNLRKNDLVLKDFTGIKDICVIS